ncbi:MAG: hypothetical protein AABZ78_03370 [Chloroflexota bacterium]
MYLSTCLLIYFIIGIQYAALTPAWQVPDEPAHYNFIKHIAQTGSLPELKKGDYDQNYLARLTSEKFPPDLSVDSVRYESWQPPLYYILATPIFLIFNGALLPLRVFSLLIGAGVIVFAYLAVNEAISNLQSPISNLQPPTSNLQPLIAVAFIAFIPQHIAMMAGVNNDSLSELIIAIGLWRILVMSNEPSAMSNSSFVIRHLSLGILLGLALITKSHAYLLAPVALVMLLLRWRSNLQSPISNLQSLILVFLPAFLIGSTFWIRNLYVYGAPDFMATIRHDSVVIGQPRTSEWITQYGTLEVARRFFQTTFQSFWGQFGWMGVVMDQRVYIALMIFSVLLVIGFIIAISRQPSAISNQQSPIFNHQSLILTISFLLTLALYLYYNLNYVQHQGRYLFPALIPLSVAVSLSLTTWADMFKFLGDKRKWLAFVPIVMMAVLCVFALYRFIIPAL